MNAFYSSLRNCRLSADFSDYTLYLMYNNTVIQRFSIGLIVRENAHERTFKLDN